ncbi:putative transcriptional regulatory protein TcrX [Rubripirellula amarantea]|uniref:Putative transcriptional regulatory protein TcrX n=1 Tax=Rubripirellula amarantea TaxID=2527999 RepID=A0A5C5WVC8_9BACT|nr:response regulator [Rubripirellula amarantea]TWT54209.1 putative transcriptional regulatory protein TcrX [Rubripirellula amarantea]
MAGPSHILVVDDSPTQLRQMQILLEQDGYQVESAVGVEEALAAIAEKPPLLVVSDMQMPGMSGLDLVEILRGTNPSLPVVLTTSEGSEDVAADALRRGAASYVPKRDLNTTLAPVVRQVLSIGESQRSVLEVAQYTKEAMLTLEIDNQESIVPAVIARLEKMLIEMDLFSECTRMQIGMALDEALLNAIVHGNLEISSELRDHGEGDEYNELIAVRKSALPYADRRVTIILHATRDEVAFTIADEGPGFDFSKVGDPTDPENLECAGGRGLFMIHAFMDDVVYNDKGNCLKMVKYVASEDEEDEEKDCHDESD